RSRPLSNDRSGPIFAQIAIKEAMKVSVVCLRRAGRVVPRWQVHRAERVVGELTVEEQLDPALYRYTRVARVVDTQHRPTDRLPPLIDATLLWVRGGR